MLNLKFKLLSLSLFLLLIFQIPLAAENTTNWAPDFLIVGAQKSGTTALYRYLKNHPQIVKKSGEVHFFDRSFNRGVTWYQNQFPSRQKQRTIVGDKSPYYLFHPLVPKRVASLYPHVKIIMILRNPVDRAYSQYWMNVRMDAEPLSFEEALKAEPTRVAGEKEKILSDQSYNSHAYPRYSYLARGIYVEQVKRWLSFFPRKQILVVSSSDLRRDPDNTVKKVFAFLGLSHYPMKNWDAEKRNDYEPMDQVTRRHLSDYFRPYNQQLEALLGITFNWN